MEGLGMRLDGSLGIRNVGTDPPTLYLIPRPLSSFHTISDEELDGSLGIRLKDTLDAFQMSVLLLEGKCTIKRQLYSKRFITLRETAFSNIDKDSI